MTQASKATAKLGILVGGGPAPGINGVIAGATTEAIRQGLEVVGIYDGFKWLAAGDTTHTCTLTLADAEECRAKGGSILRTSREKPADDAEKMARVVQALESLGIGYLVTIGGDDTAYTALKTAETSQGTIQVAHVPKTIDNDLPLPDMAPTFGYNTARAVGAELVSNLMEDARTTKRWFVVAAMGRSAGHLALGMARSGGASMAVIPEEFGGSASLDLVLSIIEGSMHKSKAMGRDYGVAVVAEGIGELLVRELEGRPYVEITRDKSNNLRLAEVPLALILKRELQARFKARGQKPTIVDITIGYELRCAPPIAFDAEYVQQLGWAAVQYVLGQRPAWGTGGALMAIRAGKVEPIPFSRILDPQTGKTAVRRVDVTSDAYLAARAAMIRLEKCDLEDAATATKLAEVAGIPVEEYKRLYAAAAAV